MNNQVMKFRDLLFSKLKSKEIEFLSLSDFDGLYNSNDIDIFVSPKDKKKFEETINCLGANKRNKPSYYKNHYMYYFIFDDYIIHLDVKYALNIAMTEEEMWELKGEYLESAYSNDKLDINLPSPFVILIYTAALYCSREKNPQPTPSSWSQSYREKWLKWYELFGSNVSQSYENDLINKIAIYAKSNTTDSPTQQEWWEPLKDYFNQKNTKTLYDKRISMGYGYVLLLEGPDGSGKSTLIKNIRNNFPIDCKPLYLGFGDHSWRIKMARNICLSPADWLKRFPRFLSILQTFIFLPIEFISRILPTLITGRHKVILVDRFPTKVFLAKSKLVRKIYSFILPKPNVTILLVGDSNKISARKPNEVSPELVESKILEANKVAKKIGSEILTIDTIKNDVSQSTRMIFAHILRDKKFKSRLFEQKK